MEVPRLGVKSELQLPAYITATAMQDLSCVCNLNQSSPQCQISNPLSEARDLTHILMDTNQILFQCAKTGTPTSPCFNIYINIWDYITYSTGQKLGSKISVYHNNQLWKHLQKKSIIKKCQSTKLDKGIFSIRNKRGTSWGKGRLGNLDQLFP